ncbi:hypothetical protein IQ255_03255 [Pleurocapsales cyanobacterium LEGE 10410]|nr:hypothetical protein [Pleurocapsales cyanobacterium LEGE 10410]
MKLQAIKSFLVNLGFAVTSYNDLSSLSNIMNLGSGDRQYEARFKRV